MVTQSMKMDPQRVKQLQVNGLGTGPVVYWMVRDQRAVDNWALLYAQELAMERKQPLVVLVALRHDLATHRMTRRSLEFMLRGLEEVEQELQVKNIGFEVLLGDPVTEVAQRVAQLKASAVVTDMSPLRTLRQWKQNLVQQVQCSVYEVDAHNVVPVWVASDKQEVGAYTIRPKLHRIMNSWLERIPTLKKQPMATQAFPTDWQQVRTRIRLKDQVDLHAHMAPGTTAGMKLFASFLEHKLHDYDIKRNDPTQNAQTGLSAYLHFGQISAQRLVYELVQMPENANTKALIEQLFVRRELADNFCYYQPHYDQVAGFPSWAQASLNAHQHDAREFLYTQTQFEQAATHDDLWNAAQMEMVMTGKMHGYMRMYWAKKILEWSTSPSEALKIAITLNDIYELDGRDPNGFAGIAWSIGGLHDRPWFERQVYGKVRYMNASGASRKFDVGEYVKRWTND